MKSPARRGCFGEFRCCFRQCSGCREQDTCCDKMTLQARERSMFLHDAEVLTLLGEKAELGGFLAAR